MRGKGEVKKAGVQDVWEGGFTELALLHCCRIVNDATDAELRASGCWVCNKVIRYCVFY